MHEKQSYYFSRRSKIFWIEWIHSYYFGHRFPHHLGEFFLDLNYIIQYRENKILLVNRIKGDNLPFIKKDKHKQHRKYQICHIRQFIRGHGFFFLTLSLPFLHKRSLKWLPQNPKFGNFFFPSFIERQMTYNIV